MLVKPSSCSGCPLETLGVGFMNPTLAVHHNGIALIGEALGEEESLQGSPFIGKAGFRLTRLIEWAGLKRENFDIYNTVWCRPPNNLLEGTPFESSAISHCRDKHWEGLLKRSKVLVPLGNVATNAILGKKGILSIRGYIEGRNGQYVLPTVHPSFIQRGQSRWSAAVINDLQKAIRLAEKGYPPQILSYNLDPSPLEAYNWAKEYRQFLLANPSTRLAFDIETPGKGDDEDDVDLDSEAPDRTWNIERIGFSYRSLDGLSIPWANEYLAAIKLLLGSDGDKVVWNAGFDVPRVRRAGVEIRGTIHDGMVAWHILHTDLPKSLKFVATFTCPWQPAWKHLSGLKPAYYNCTDADVEFRSMIEIEDGLRRAGLWGVYQKDVLDLEPILVHMHQKGMPIDSEIRLDRAIKLDSKLREVRVKMEQAVPLEARRVAHVYKNTPRDTSGLSCRSSVRLIPTCSNCGLERPRKDHFKRFVKKSNPCANAGVRETTKDVKEFYRLAEFSPSRDQLIRYHQWLKRPNPMVWDKKTQSRKISFGEREIKNLRGKYPLDPLYGSVLDYRSITKIAGTYIGRPVED